MLAGGLLGSCSLAWCWHLLTFNLTLNVHVDILTLSVFCSFCLPVMMAKEKPPITVVGDVGGRIAIIVVRLQALSDCLERNASPLH